MSLQSKRSSVSRLQKQVADLRKKISDEQRKAASNQSQIGRVQRSMQSSSSASAIGSKMSQLERYSKDAATHTKRIADFERQLANKQKQLHSAQDRLAREEERQQKRIAAADKKQQEENLQYQRAITREIRNQHQLTVSSAAAEPPGMSEHTEEVYDAFISHASEDKDDLVRPLVLALKERGMRVWYDESLLRVGDSLRRSIDRGLSKSRFGIVVLSTHFFEKNWPQYELDGLVSREMAGAKVVLPIWHKVSVDEVRHYSPTLADKVALNSSVYSIKEIAEKLVEELGMKE